MTSDEFLASVLARLPVITSEDSPVMQECITQMHSHGWTVDDTVAYCLCLEEVNPDLDEETALARMKPIREKYEGTFLL